MRALILVFFSLMWSIKELDPVGCGICLDCDPDAYTAVMDCGHCFHPECLKKALKHSRKCPICTKNMHANTRISNDLDVVLPGTLPIVHSTEGRIITVLDIGFQLVYAARLGQIEVVHHLLTGAAVGDINFAVPPNRPHLNKRYGLVAGTTPMIEACKGGYLNIVQLLLQTDPGLDISVRDSTGRSALLAAADAGYRHYRIVDILFEKDVRSTR